MILSILILWPLGQKVNIFYKVLLMKKIFTFYCIFVNLWKSTQEYRRLVIRAKVFNNPEPTFPALDDIRIHLPRLGQTVSYPTII